MIVTIVHSWEDDGWGGDEYTVLDLEDGEHTVQINMGDLDGSYVKWVTFTLDTSGDKPVIIDEDGVTITAGTSKEYLARAKHIYGSKTNRGVETPWFLWNSY